MTDPILHLPLGAILPDALLRDRSALDPTAQAELTAAILARGLRQPIEVWELSTPRGGATHGLISGFRRLAAFRELARLDDRFAAIPAFLRRPESIAAAMADMLAENEVRSAPAPWDRGRVLVDAVDEGIFPSLDTAILGLHPALTRQSRARLRALAEVVEALSGQITTPERLSARQMERLSLALRAGLGDLIEVVLADHRGRSLDAQWQALLPVLTETGLADKVEIPATPGRPRRILRLPQGLTIRRERSGQGWILRFSGPEARDGGLIDDVLDHVERWFLPSSNV